MARWLALAIPLTLLPLRSCLLMPDFCEACRTQAATWDSPGSFPRDDVLRLGTSLSQRVLNVWVVCLGMTKALRVEIPDDEYEELRRVKDWNGLTWREVIHVGVDALDDPSADTDE